MNAFRFFALAALLPLGGFADLEEVSEKESTPTQVPAPTPKEENRWYFEVEPGYFYFTDKDMRDFFGDGTFTIRAETGYKFWKPLTVWIDAGYLQKDGSALGGTEKLHLRIASLSFGLKALFTPHEVVSLYVGAAPRLFMMLLHNECLYVRSEDNQVGIGGGFDAGLWLYPFPQNRNIFFDFFIDYSLKRMKTEEDPDCSFNFDVDISGITAGGGIGIKF